MDLDVLRADQSLPAPTLARQAALRSGAHMFTAAHARFDSSLSGLCEDCRVPDTPEHRVCHCPRYQAARSRFPWLSARWSQLPACITHHLLVPENPFLASVRSYLVGLPGPLDFVQSCPPSVSGRQHLFTDGAGLYQGTTCVHGQW